MNLYDYKTGSFIRALTPEEEDRYNEISNNGTCEGGTGAVDGQEFGHDGTVYAQ